MMRHSETMRAASRLLLSHPIVCLLAALAVMVLWVLGPIKVVHAADTTPPDTTITDGPSGDLTGTTAKFTFFSNEAGSTFKCKLVGQDSTRTTCSSPKDYTNLTAGTKYTFKVWATDAAGNIDPTPATRTFTPRGGGGGTEGSTHLVGAGDIASQGDADVATGDLIDARPEAIVFTAGDNAYPMGSLSNYTNKYEPAWGPFKARTRPSPGNHEYMTSGASGYKTYFSGVPEVSTNPTYYAYNLGAWRIYSLDSNLTGAAMNTQLNWLSDDLASTNTTCELAYWHHPVASSGQHGPTTLGRQLFAELDSAGADLVLNGHDHNYERFEKINSSGQPSANGIVEIVIGTGGTDLRGQGFVQPGSQKRNFDTHGIVDINLSSTGYSGEFVPVPGTTFTDNFSGTCGT
jgi:acid phosphatase type 7